LCVFLDGHNGDAMPSMRKRRRGRIERSPSLSRASIGTLSSPTIAWALASFFSSFLSDIEAHAEELEADLTKYPQLKDLVVGCLKAKLPPGWKPVKDENSDEMYVDEPALSLRFFFDFALGSRCGGV
jgi:hypothetical protein